METKMKLNSKGKVVLAALAVVVVVVASNWHRYYYTRTGAWMSGQNQFAGVLVRMSAHDAKNDGLIYFEWCNMDTSEPTPVGDSCPGTWVFSPIVGRWEGKAFVVETPARLWAESPQGQAQAQKEEQENEHKLTQAQMEQAQAQVEQAQAAYVQEEKQQELAHPGEKARAEEERARQRHEKALQICQSAQDYQDCMDTEEEVQR